MEGFGGLEREEKSYSLATVSWCVLVLDERDAEGTRVALTRCLSVRYVRLRLLVRIPVRHCRRKPSCLLYNQGYWSNWLVKDPKQRLVMTGF
jgi:hypothetical protein